jgi:hypothetical protein
MLRPVLKKGLLDRGALRQAVRSAIAASLFGETKLIRKLKSMLSIFKVHPTSEWLEREHQFQREVAEVGLKYVSWSVLLAAIYVAYTKSGNNLLLLAVIVVSGLLYWYLYGHLMRIDINIIPVEKLIQRPYFLLALAIHVIIVSTMLIGTTRSA